MDAKQINWQQTCCAWHGEYAEVQLPNGGVARLKRAPDIEGYLICRFSEENRAVDMDADGVPVYVQITEADLALM